MTSETDIEDLVLVDFDDRGQDGRIARVTFNNPQKRNALGVGGKQRFINVMTELRHDESLRALVITGAGEQSFVGGSNLADMAHYKPADGHAASTKTHYACDAVRTFPVPVIARINGYCFGSGMEIAAAADMRVAADHAKFGMPETRFGIPSGMEAALLPRLIGWGKAVELVLTGDHIDALANAVRVQKRLINDWERMSITDAAKVGIEAIAGCYATDEPHTLMTAFVNKKKS